MKDLPLLLIHGYPFSHTMWFSTIAALGSAARVFAPDLPGFGKNPVRRKSKASLEQAADFCAELLDEARKESAVVAGMSMGGYVALAFAQKYPGRTRGLGLISTQAAADTPEAREGRLAMIKRIRAGGPNVASEAILPKMFSDVRGKNPTLRDYPVEGALAAGVDGLCWAQEAMAARPDRTALVQSVDIPVLVAHGSEDKIVSMSKARELAETLRKPILVELRGVGHASPLEAPDQIAAALARLMARCRGEEAGTF